jgi:hypothetical protein
MAYVYFMSLYFTEITNEEEEKESIIPILNNVLEEEIPCDNFDDIDVKYEDPLLLCDNIEDFCVSNVCLFLTKMCQLNYPHHFEQTRKRTTTQKEKQIGKELFDLLIRFGQEGQGQYEGQGQEKPLFEEDSQNTSGILESQHLDENQEQWHQFHNFIDESGE